MCSNALRHCVTVKVLKMGVKCLIFKLLLFQMLVVWCGAKHVTIDRVEFPAEVDADIQEDIRNFIHNGLYSHVHLDPAQLQVVTPLKVSRDGELVSRQVDHEHEHGHARARRDLHGRDHQMDHVLHYNLTVDGRDLRLDLRPSVTFITPAMVVERHMADSRTRERPHPKSTGCHYTGNVRGQPKSSIAVSACDGLAGFLRTEHGEYFIEPSNHIPEDPSESRTHVIFRRSAVDKVNAWHRSKRAVDSMTPPNKDKNSKKNTGKHPKRNRRRNRDHKEMIDRQRREYLERRRKQLEDLRTNPTEYRLHKKNQRIESRRQSDSRSSSSISEDSLESNHAKNAKLIIPRRIRKRPLKGRSRKKKNCATKQPPYPFDKAKSQKYQQNKNRRKQQFPKFDNSKRNPRSVSKPRHVEVLLVADRSMTEFHKSDKLEKYLLTIMNMVSTLYMDPSIGNYIKVVVVKIILVVEVRAAPDLEVSTNADATLNSFCKWQMELNPEDDENPHHHDVAILVTRKDICSKHDTPCSTLGVAHVAGMCKPDLSCSVNEDNGITLAHTITHELGHNFGLYHDTEKIGCHRREGSTLHIMTPVFEVDTVQVAWSRCSKRDVTNFLDAGLGECLGDTPSQDEYSYPEVPPGVMYDTATQCYLEFGGEAQVCSESAELCQRLWCLLNNTTCTSMLRPAAPGTSCGHNMWCQNRQCVEREPAPRPRDGAWGEWSSWSECSRTCGAGVSTQSRECNNPEPENNGKYCIGERSRYKICNTDPCPLGEPSFREVQCSKYANSTYNNETINEWEPYFDQDKPCELQCVPKNRDDIDMLGGFVADGTPCRQLGESRDMCIAGVCHKVGCDWIVDSDAEEDACGVCGGNGSACKTVQGIYSKGTTKDSGFSEVAVIPAGSRNVKIQEKVNPGNYISIGSAKTQKFYLNGARNQTVTEYFVAGSHAIYERDRDWEKVRIQGPIAEDIKVYQRIFSRGKHRNPGVTYQYTVDNKKNHQQRKRYRYKMSDWSSCSVTCGRGYTRRYLQCVDETERVVEQQQCYHLESPRHEALMAHCQQPECAHTHWWVGPWNSCSHSCRMPGQEPIRTRNVYCVDKINNQVIEQSACDPTTKPMNKIICADLPPC